MLNVYPCIECGYYAQSFTQLKIHTLSHKVQDVSDSDEEPQVKMKKDDVKTPNFGSQPTSTPLSSMKNYHPKAFSGKRYTLSSNKDQSKNRKKYPCDKCDRVWVIKNDVAWKFSIYLSLNLTRLLTHQGWLYHQLVHSNSKPFKCRHCPAVFRSKQACDEHEKALHRWNFTFSNCFSKPPTQQLLFVDGSNTENKFVVVSKKDFNKYNESFEIHEFRNYKYQESYIFQIFFMKCHRLVLWQII